MVVKVDLRTSKALDTGYNTTNHTNNSQPTAPTDNWMYNIAASLSIAPSTAHIPTHNMFQVLTNRFKQDGDNNNDRSTATNSYTNACCHCRDLFRADQSAQSPSACASGAAASTVAKEERAEEGPSMPLWKLRAGENADADNTDSESDGDGFQVVPRKVPPRGNQCRGCRDRRITLRM